MLSSFPCHDSEAIHCARPTAGVASSGASWMQWTTLTRAHFCPFFCSMKKRCMSATFICLLYDQTISAFSFSFLEMFPTANDNFCYPWLDLWRHAIRMHIHFCEWNNQGVFVALCCRTNKDLYPHDVCLPWSTRRRISIIGAHRHGWALHLPPATAIVDGDTVSSSGAAILILTDN